jgi:anti-anti-sigma factor
MTTDNARFHSGMRSFVTDLLDVEVVRDERDVVDEPDVAVVFVRGELDRTGVPWLAGCLREVLNRGGQGGSVVLNLTGMTFVDVGGVRLLTEVTRWAAARSLRLYLAGCSAELVRLLRLAGMLDEVDLIPTGPM